MVCSGQENHISQVIVQKQLRLRTVGTVYVERPRQNVNLPTLDSLDLEVVLSSSLSSLSLLFFLDLLLK